MRTLAQQRAEFALNRVLQSMGRVTDKEKFASFVAGAPAMILQNGFGQTLAFWLAKGTKDGRINDNDKHVILFDIVKDWLSLKDKDIRNNFALSGQRVVLMREISEMQQNQYLSAQSETLSLLEWVKRFANADLS
jgi:CRISPR-associated protein Cmr5